MCERMCFSVEVNLSEWADCGGVYKHTAYRTGKLILVNLCDWPEIQASSGLVGAGALVDTQATSDDGADPGPEHESTRVLRSDRKTQPLGKAIHGEARIESQKGKRNPARGCYMNDRFGSWPAEGSRDIRDPRLSKQLLGLFEHVSV